MFNVDSMTQKDLERTYTLILDEGNEEVATALYNSIYTRKDTEFITLHREQCTLVLEKAILKKIRDQRKIKEPLESMEIRKTDVIRKW